MHPDVQQMFMKPLFCASTVPDPMVRERERHGLVASTFSGSWSSVEDSQTSKAVIPNLCFDKEE